MNDVPRRQSHAFAWSVGAAVVLTLYVGSTGPIRYWQIKGSVPDPLPHWLKVFYRPVAYFYELGPMQKPMDSYSEWWWRMAGMPFPPNGSFYELRYYKD
jgi:hypothetical protein